jgi:hypothetical protein
MAARGVEESKPGSSKGGAAPGGLAAEASSTGRRSELFSRESPAAVAAAAEFGRTRAPDPGDTGPPDDQDEGDLLLLDTRSTSRMKTMPRQVQKVIGTPLPPTPQPPAGKAEGEEEE